MKTYITQFLEHLEIERGRSQNTIKSYHFYMERFYNWLSEHKVKKWEDLTLEDVRKYRLWLNRTTDQFGNYLKKNTQNYHLIAVRAFLKYLAKRDIKSLAAEKVELAKVEQRQVDFLEGSDLDRLLEAPIAQGSMDKKPKIALRDKAILELLFCTGLRVSELAKLKKDQVNLEKDEFTIRGKGDKLRIVFLSDQARHWLKEYLKVRQDMNPFLFVSHDKANKKREADDDQFHGVTPRTIQRIVEKYAKKAGITKHVTPHTLRHSYATDLLNNGADIRSVQAMLGHESITTTQVYTHITNKQLHKIHQDFHNKKAKK
jgi:site-specific recombinase XerD